MQVDPALEARFPAEALARVTLYTTDGRTVTSDVCAARGDPANPLPDSEVEAKFARLAARHLSAERAEALRVACQGCADLDDVGALVALLAPPLDKEG